MANAPTRLSTSDWAGIHAALDAGRFAAHSADGGYRARNHTQRWSTRFDDEGFTTTPDGGGWTWGLELASYGIADRALPRSSAAAVRSEGQRVTRDWDSNLTEWYVNDSRGLEHGYTVHRRPEKGAGPLRLTLETRGTLRPEILENARDVHFVDAAGVARLTYSGLTVFDAAGRRLPARFENIGDRLCVHVDERNARYPLTVDPVAQQAYLKASNTSALDGFGFSVSISGNTVVVGARLEDSNATGVDGDQNDNSASASGAAYVFVRNGATWTQQAYLKASNTDADDDFGFSVAVSGDTIVVGARGERSNATGVDGNQLNNSSLNAGAAYVFVRNGSTWSQQAYLKASNSFAGDEFGRAVAVSGDTIVVGAVGEDGGATGVNGNATDNSAADAGAAYVFVRNGATWSQQAYLKASNTGAGDRFGGAVSVSGETVAVGAEQEDSNAVGIDGNPLDNSAPNAGAVYVFARTGTTWSQEAYVKASNTEPDVFGCSVSVSGNTLAVGARLEDSAATGVNGNQADNSGGNSGAAYVFVRNGTTWSQQAYVKPSNTGANDLFGWSISLSGNVLVVGAIGEDSSAVGIDGNGASNAALNSGAAYVFVRSGSTWSELAYLKASNTGASDQFGVSVAASGDTVLVGADLEDSNATGVNGNQANNSAGSAGAAYVFDLDTDPGTTVYGTGSPGCAGVQTLGVTHAPMAGLPTFGFTCDAAPPSSLGLLLVGDVQNIPGIDPFGIGVLLHVDLLASVELIPLDLFSDATGFAMTVPFAIPSAVVGNTYYACALWGWTTCALPPYGLSTSRGLAIEVLFP